MNIDLERFQAGFLEEAAEHVATIEQLLLAGNLLSYDAELLDAIFRAAHSIKGGAGTFGFPRLATVTHELESLFDRVRRRETDFGDGVVDAALQALDVVREMCAMHRQSESVPSDYGSEAIGALRRLAGAPVSGPASPSAGSPGSEREANVVHILYTASDAGRKETVHALLLDGLASFGTIRQLDVGASFQMTLETDRSTEEIRELVEFAADDGDEIDVRSADLTETVPPDVEESLARPAEAGVRPETERRSDQRNGNIRVSLAKVDELINLVGEIVTAENILSAAVHGFSEALHPALYNAAEKVARHTRDLRQKVMAIRMVPVSLILGRFPRVVRETSAKAGKRVALRLVGEETELDKTIVERIIDPLTHLVRNAIDHGIESPEERVAAGKTPEGHVDICASHQSGHIVLEVRDDGGGLNRSRIIAKARSRGLVIDDDAADKDVWDLVFHPGFSTADEVTEISGRGVGMDVVRQNVLEMGGTVSIESEAGRGTTVRITLPLTLAILDGLTVLVGTSAYVVPITNVVSSVQQTDGMILHLPSGAEVLMFDGAWIPVRRLRTIFEHALDGDSRNGIVVVVESAQQRAALLVDALEAHQQLVIKNIETNFRRIPGIAGATVINNGVIALILDVAALVRSDLSSPTSGISAA